MANKDSPLHTIDPNENFESSGDDALDKAISLWLSLDRNKETLEEISNLVKNKEFDGLRDRLLSKLSFGTAGIRKRMQAGFGYLNQLTIIQIAQALSSHIKQILPNPDQRRVIIGYDGRHNSQTFALLVTNVLRKSQISTLLYTKCVPTPLVAFGVRHFKCICGVMITASHNPKCDNGFKLFWECTAQADDKHEAAVIAELDKNVVPEDSFWDFSQIDDNYDILNEAINNYLVELDKLCFYKNAFITVPDIVYTAMHGVGASYVSSAFDYMGISSSLNYVEMQCEIDPDFSTVTFPNPEEPSSLSMAMSFANSIGARIVFANDPDADRLALAEKQDNGEWKIFTGDQMASLFIWFLLHCLKELTGNEIKNTCMVTSVVSSKFMETVSKAEGFIFHETLTGFKWIGNLCDDLLRRHHSVLFAYEEAIGFMSNSAILDKDGVSAAYLLAQIAGYLHATETKCSLNDQLERLYCKYGRHLTCNSYFTSPSHEVTLELFNDLRNYDGTDNYPQYCGNYKIRAIRDLTTGFDSNFSDNMARIPLSLTSPMITFYFDNSVFATIRASGTEPKIKYYIELIGKPREEGVDDEERLRVRLKKFVDSFVKFLIRPSRYNLISRN